MENIMDQNLAYVFLGLDIFVIVLALIGIVLHYPLLKRAKKQTGVIRTMPSHFYVGCTIFFMLFSLGAGGGSLAYALTSRNQGGIIVLFGLGAGFFILSSVIEFMILIDHEEITKQGYVIVRFGRRKTLPRNAVKNVGVTAQGLYYRDANGKKLFTQNMGTIGMDAFLAYAISNGATCTDSYVYKLIDDPEIKKKVAPFLNDIDIDEPLPTPAVIEEIQSPETQAYLAEVGKRHRGQRAKHALIWTIFAPLFCITVGVFAHLRSGSNVPLVMALVLGGLGVLFAVIGFFSMKRNEEKRDDADLGLSWISLDEKTIGSAKRRKTAVSVTVAMAFGCACIFGAISIRDLVEGPVDAKAGQQIVTALVSAEERGETILLNTSDPNRYFTLSGLGAKYFPLKEVQALEHEEPIYIVGHENGNKKFDGVSKPNYAITFFQARGKVYFGQEQWNQIYTRQHIASIVCVSLCGMVALTPLSLFYYLPKFNREEAEESFDAQAMTPRK